MFCYSLFDHCDRLLFPSLSRFLSPCSWVHRRSSISSFGRTLTPGPPPAFSSDELLFLFSSTGEDDHRDVMSMMCDVWHVFLISSFAILSRFQHLSVISLPMPGLHCSLFIFTFPLFDLLPGF